MLHKRHQGNKSHISVLQAQRYSAACKCFVFDLLYIPRAMQQHACVCVYTHTYTHTHAYMHAHTHTHTHTLTDRYIHTYIHIYIDEATTRAAALSSCSSSRMFAYDLCHESTENFVLGLGSR
jgi:hypothetical protein